MKRHISLTWYRTASTLIKPFLGIYLAFRKKKGKEDLERFPERLGLGTKKRPAGKLLWIHGASVGETLSALPLIDALLKKYPKLHIMVTSGTVTSACLLEKRLPKRAFHQYIPIDCFPFVRRFVEYWNPDAVMWLESEFWPNILSVIKEKDIPLILVNGRVSEKSFASWQKLPLLSSQIQEMFTISFGQTQQDAARLAALGAKNAQCVGNIKCAAAPLPVDPKEYESLFLQLRDRPCWVAASTHKGEEASVLYAHKQLKKKLPKLLTIVVPRHPQRGEEVERLFKKEKIKTNRRSLGEKITSQTDVYLADTIGELGLFYKLASVAFVGGSLIKFGGQNILEPARLGKAVITGPYTHNFKEIVERAIQADAVSIVKDKEELADCLGDLLKHPKTLAKFQSAATGFVKEELSVLDKLIEVMEQSLPLGAVQEDEKPAKEEQTGKPEKKSEEKDSDKKRKEKKK